MVTIAVEEKESQHNKKQSFWASQDLFSIALIMLTIGVIWRILDQFVFGLGDTWMNILPSKLFPFLIIISFFWVFRRSEIESVLGLSLRNWKIQLAFGVFMGVLIAGLIDIGGTVFYAIFFDPTYPLELRIIDPELLGYMLFFFVTNAFLEETLFRGLLQNSLKTKLTINRAILLSALSFGVWHAGWPLLNAEPGQSVVMEVTMMIFTTTLLGILFGVYYEKFSSGKSLMGLVVAHTIFNWVSECFKVGPQPSVQGPDLVFATSGIMMISLAMFFFVFSILFFTFWKYKIEQLPALWNRIKVRGLLRKETTVNEINED